ncbi:unnamed protein product [Eruca vesicaria subsp. sativa]|uniref:Uncharacterized protein n=1 Tax=Eruca vesicaria subsp. sativa TaxID=29727 RepID=A0ABC8LUW6_ERUVS|nr:unnamed protein product [Eruca vesicaria subsp. sativa]
MTYENVWLEQHNQEIPRGNSYLPIRPNGSVTWAVIRNNMEGLIPFVYRAFMQIRYGDDSSLSSSYYVRLPGDSGRFEISDIEVSGHGSSSNMASSKTTTTTTTFTGGQSPVHRRVVT